jgi:DNA-binding protein HU-beta
VITREESAMTKAELIDAVARVSRQPRKSVEITIDLAFEQIARSIRREKRFWVPGFGTFTVRRRRARAGFNPRTKTAMTIAAARTVGFRPAPELKKGL